MKKTSQKTVKVSSPGRNSSRDIHVDIPQTKAAGAAAGAALGAIVAGPVGAVVGGVVGTMVAGNTDKIGRAVATASKSPAARKVERAVTKVGQRATRALKEVKQVGGKAARATGVRLIAPKGKASTKAKKPAASAPKSKAKSKPAKPAAAKKTPPKRPARRKS